MKTNSNLKIWKVAFKIALAFQIFASPLIARADQQVAGISRNNLNGSVDEQLLKKNFEKFKQEYGNYLMEKYSLLVKSLRNLKNNSTISAIVEAVNKKDSSEANRMYSELLQQTEYRFILASLSDYSRNLEKQFVVLEVLLEEQPSGVKGPYDGILGTGGMGSGILAVVSHRILKDIKGYTGALEKNIKLIIAEAEREGALEYEKASASKNVGRWQAELIRKRTSLKLATGWLYFFGIGSVAMFYKEISRENPEVTFNNWGLIATAVINPEELEEVIKSEGSKNFSNLNVNIGREKFYERLDLQKNQILETLARPVYLASLGIDGK